MLQSDSSSIDSESDSDSDTDIEHFLPGKTTINYNTVKLCTLTEPKEHDDYSPFPSKMAALLYTKLHSPRPVVSTIHKLAIIKLTSETCPLAMRELLPFFCFNDEYSGP